VGQHGSNKKNTESIAAVIVATVVLVEREKVEGTIERKSKNRNIKKILKIKKTTTTTTASMVIESVIDPILLLSSNQTLQIKYHKNHKMEV